MSDSSRQTPKDETPELSPTITRKDFLNTTLLGVGAALLGAAAPAEPIAKVAAAGAPAARPNSPPFDPWTGPGGVGDYSASNGNTLPVMDAAHKIRDGLYNRAFETTDTGETYDLVIVGGGITGLSAAYFFAKNTDGRKTCLVLDDHPIFGGEAKQNEFVVDGTHLIAPQGSNDFGVPREGAGWQSEMWDDLRMPREFTWSEWTSSLPPLRMSQDNYQPMEGIGEYGIDIGYFFDAKSIVAPTAKPSFLRNIWQNDLVDVPVSNDVRKALLEFRTAPLDTRGMEREQFARYLDTMSYRDYLEKVRGYPREVTRMIEPVVGLISGASPDAVSAHATQQIGMPGVSRPRGRNGGLGLSFPGGNVTYGRHLVKKLIPGAIAGDFTFDGVLTGRVNWAALDRANQPTRVRAGVTVMRVQHAGSPESTDHVVVTYAKGSRLFSVRARRVAMASGGWVTKHIVSDLPGDISKAYDEFVYAPALIANVALTNWRFMYKLGITAARWFDAPAAGFGFVANLRRQMVTAGYHAPMDPDKPAVLTFYTGIYTPGLTVREQGMSGRNRLLQTTYAEYERAIVGQMQRQFGSSGFDAKRDVAGVILNRWGHARLVQPPGWYYGVNGAAPAREVVAKGFGRIAIGHSELNGHQSATGAIAQGKRIAEASLGQ